VRQFRAHLLEIRDLPMVFWTSGSPTAAVERCHDRGGHHAPRRQRDHRPHFARAYILQGLLDRLAHDPDNREARALKACPVLSPHSFLT